MREDDCKRVSKSGAAAWQRLKKTPDWYDWLKVGEAVLVGRQWAMRQASTNRPIGAAYNMAFGEWLKQNKLSDMDKGDRSRLFDVMENVPAIEEWRHRTLTLTDRLKLNHPNAVLRKWQAAKRRPAFDREDQITELKTARATEPTQAACAEQLITLLAAADPQEAAETIRQIIYATPHHRKMPPSPS
jgi:hypothetical protein